MSAFRRSAFLAPALFLAFTLPSLQAQQPISGQPVAAFAPVDTIMQNLMTQYSSPGSAVAISYNGKLVYARGYGYAETATNNPVQPDTIMRLASNSKLLTAEGVFKLIEDGKLSLTTKPFATIFTDLTPPAGTTFNTQLNDITIEDLLLHTGGWDDTEVPDPVFEFEDVDGFTPVTPEELISYMLSQPLQHTPGTTYAYSNLGYVTLGQVISKVYGGNYTSYETYMQNEVFNPVGLNRIQPASTFLNEQLPDEAAYYDYPGAPLVTNVYDPQGGEDGYDCSPASASCVPFPYGGYSLPLNHANGGWVASAIDLVREWDIMNGQITPAILSDPGAVVSSSNYYPVPPYGSNYIYTFFGSLPGTNSLAHLDTTTAYGGKLTFAAVFNTRDGNNIEEPETDATNQIAAALLNVTTWPTNNLFTIYSGTASSCAFTLGSSTATVAIGGGTGSVTVTDKNYCAWLSISNNSWIHVTAGALNSNSGSTSYSVDANTTGTSRTGTITIAGSTFSIMQTGPTTTLTTLTASPTAATVGQPITFTATVKKSSGSGTPTGSVAFYFGTVELESVALTSGSAKFTVSTNGLPPGSYPLTASYSGDSSDAESKSSAATVTVSKAPTTTTLAASPNPDTPPASLKFTATVKRSASGATGTATGAVTFYYSTLALSTVNVNSSGVATYTIGTTGFPAGTYPVTAKYAGDTLDNASNAAAVNVVVK